MKQKEQAQARAKRREDYEKKKRAEEESATMSGDFADSLRKGSESRIGRVRRPSSRLLGQ